CRWCKAAPKCRAYANMVYSRVAEEFTTCEPGKLTPINPHLLTDAEMAAVYKDLALIEKWCEKVKTTVTAKLMAGDSLPGLKLVKGKAGARKWANAEEVEELICQTFDDFGRFYSQPVLISPTQAEKVLKANPERWEMLTPYITRSAGSPTVAFEEDPRAAIDVNPANDFDVIQ
ncbi:DUF2800 domain-containing protein, partial [Herbiconiux daphne]